MSIPHGINAELEAEANKLLFADDCPPEVKSGLLTPWKEQYRKSREVYAANGTPDASVRRGMFNRAANQALPHLNACEGHVRPYRRIRDGAWDLYNGH